MKHIIFRSTRSSVPKKLALLLLLFATCLPAWAADYVFMQGSNYIIINSSGALTTTTTFNPSTCLWSGTSGGAFTNNGYTLKYSQNDPSGSGTFYYTTTLNTTGTNVPLVISADGTIQFTANVSATYNIIIIFSGWNPTPGTWYIQYNGTNVVTSTTSSSTNNIKAYLVTTTEIPALTYIEGIEGNDAIGLTGTYNYSKIGAATVTTSPYTKYTFNGETYYKLSDNTITSTAPSEEFTYTWSATCNDVTYTGFSINATTGALSITSLPSTDKTLTITLQATKTGQETQTVTKTVNVSNRPPTGTVGGTVYLNDYEDHTWTYYAGVSSDVDGGNYNTNYVGKMYSPNPRNVKITYQANGGQVSISESETTFVYYKTIEKVGGTYKYQVISNPFSKRPTGKGFGGWEVVSGGSYIGKTDGAVLALDEELTLTGLDNNYTVNCTSAEIVLKATWVNANVTYLASVVSNNSNYTYNPSTTGDYEKNILVINKDYSGTITASKPVTVTMVDPATGTRGNYTFSGNITPNNTGVTKIENATWNPSGNIDAKGRNFTIGRGMTMEGTARTLYGLNTSSTAMNQILIVESGTFSGYRGCNTKPSSHTKQIVVFGNDYDRAKKDNDKLSITGSIYGLTTDQDMDFNDISKELFHITTKSGKFYPNPDLTDATYSNSFYLFDYSADNNGTRTLVIEGGEFGHIAGGANSTSGDNTVVNLKIRMKGGSVNGSIFGGAAQYNVSGSKQFVFTGGTIKGWIAGGSNGSASGNQGSVTGYSYVYIGGNTQVNSNGNTNTLNAGVGGTVYAAGCGQSSTATSGRVALGTNVVVADKAYVERGVYGGGSFGYCPTDKTSNIYITGGEIGGISGATNFTGMTGLIIQSPTYSYSSSITGGVYGGACQNSGGAVNIYMTNGLVNGGLYGGSNVSGTINQNVKMVVTGGQVGTATNNANIHGGGYGASTTVSQNVDVTLGTRNTTTGVTSGTAVVYGDVYGGSALGKVNGTSATTTYKTNVTLNAGTINGSLYGGALGDSTTAANVYGPVAVKVYGGSVKKTDENGANGSGAVYGANNINGAPQRAVTVDIYGTDPAPASGGYALFSVYGGGNKADYTYGNGYPKVTVHNCNNSIEYVYGGGNAAAVAATDVTIYGGNKIGNVFGGGNGQVTAANVNGSTSVKIYGGTIGDVYGGSNTNGTIGGTISVTVNSQAETSGDDPCPMAIDNVYGGGNKAASQSGTVNIGCTGTYVAASGSTPESGYIRNVYGGANQANIGTSSNPSNISLTIKAGHIDNVFGGNNNSGTINGTITVTVKEDSTNYSCGMLVGNVYGGGNLASYGSGSDYPVVKIEKGHLTGSVFGGGKGSATDSTHATGAVTGNPQVTIGSTTSTDVVTIDGNVFGGGDAANVIGSPEVLVQNCNTKIGTTSTTGGDTTYTNGSVYGGGNAAHVTGTGSNTSVTINGGTINRVFGGGNGEVSAANVAGNATTTIHGGTIHQAFAGSNAAGTISGTAKITVDHDATYSSCTEEIDEVYGGGNIAAGNAGTVDIECGAIIGDVYGGANQANVTSAITLNIAGGTIGRVFGGNNTSGNITGAITVNIDKASDCDTFSVGNVYGAGNKASYTPTTPDAYPAVNIKNGTVSQNVYGGGLGSTATVTSNPVVTLKGGTVTGHIFGGGDAAPVTGNPTVVANYGSTTNIYAGGKGSTAIVTGSPTATINLTSGKTLSVADVFGGGDAAAVQAPTSGTSVCTVNMQAGSVSHIYGGGNQAGVSTTDVNVSGGAITGGLYGGCNTSGTVTGAIAVDVTGGTIGTSSTPANVHGGGYGSATATGGNVAVTINGSSATIHGDVYGGSALGNVNDASTETTTVTLTSGAINGNLYGGGLGDATYAAGVAGKTVVSVTGGTVNNVFGCNNVNGKPVGGAAVTVSGGTIYDNVYGGGNLAAASVSPVVTINGGTMDNVYGGGLGSTAVITGSPVVTINKTATSMTVVDVFGGGDAAGVQAPTSGTSVCIVNMQAGSVSHIYGGGNQAGVSTTDVNVSGGAITGGLYGGCNTSGTVAGAIAVDVTGGTIGTSSTSANVHGGGYGSATATGGNVAVTINGTSAVIYGDVYGGSALGNVNDASTETTTVTLTSGTINGDLYGGGLGNSTYPAGVAGSTVVAINGGTVNNVFGCNNANGAPATGATVTVNGGTINNNVYGGGNLAAASVSPVVNIYNGTLPGSVFGGGKGDPSDTDHAIAMITGNPQVTIGTTTGTVAIAGNVFGGGDAANVKGATTVTVNNCNTLIGAKTTAGVWNTTAGTVYGGGNAADVVKNGTSGGSTSVIINGGDIYRVFGGGNGEGTDNPGANVANGTNVAIHAGKIHQAFAGSNAKGNITGSSAVTIDHDVSTCGELIDEVYGGGNLAAGNAGAVTVECGAVIGDLYGGANQANVTSAITLNVTGGTITRVFGGNNTSGNITGKITVNINKDNDCSTFSVGTVYGAGNQASYAPTTAGAYPEVNILNGKVTNDVFGGGLGASATVTSSPVVNVNGGNVGGDVYGGGSLASVTGSTTVNLKNANSTVTGNIYGGGLGCNDCGASSAAVAANVSGSTSVNISMGTVSNVFGCNNVKGAPSTGATVTVTGGTISNNVYGGGNLAAASVSPVVNIYNGILPGSVFGGGKGDPSDTDHAIATITGSPSVTIGDDDSSHAVTISGNVFGGGDAANVVGVPCVTVNDCVTTIGTKTTGTANAKEGTVYGGGNAAHVTGTSASGTNNGTNVIINGGNIYRVFAGGNGVVSPANIAGSPSLTVKGGNINEIYGGSNSQGTIGSTPTITIAQIQNADCPLVITDLYGGGNEAPSPGVTLVVQGCDSIVNVYGGANRATITGDVTLTINSGRIGNVFGGNNNGGVIKGEIVVNIDSNATCWNVNNVYGGGNLAIYSVYGYNDDGTPKTSGTAEYDDPQVNIKKGNVKNNVFGAGKGDGTTVSTGVYKGHLFGNTNVNMTGGSCKNVYGGGDAAPVSGNTNVTINIAVPRSSDDEYHVKEYVFGGGLGATAKISGNTNVTIKGNTAIGKNVYGGGNAGDVEGDTNVVIGEDEEE